MNTVKLANTREKNKKGFTLIELLVVFGLLALVVTIGAAVYRNMTAEAAITAQANNANFLTKAVVTAMTLDPTVKTAVEASTAVKPMTTTRANALLAMIAGDLGGGKVIVEAGYTIPADAEFPTGWGETAAGVFDPVP